MRKITFILALWSILCIGCTEPEHFISEANYRKEVQKQFDSRKDLLQNRKEDLLSVFQQELSDNEKEALVFLYAYMPLSDLADYDGAFFLKQVQTAFKAKETFAWGKYIPEQIFRHFVLPYRVNNEDLDTARVVFFNELKGRLKGLSMHDAALEVNHWCHEKVNYKACDSRTSAPLATVKTSWGRCGEESTFTVAAMRAVGIPARQVYTPRWAHTNDNHAWVEVYVDGKWQYLGACEPEPVLNKGWFDKPVKQAMMVHTRVFGKYRDNSTNNLEENPLFTKINTLENYTKTKNLTVKVVDTQENAVSDAEVRFGIYNYAEFYPMVVAKSDANGNASITTGLGDLLISATKGAEYGEAKAVGTEQDTVLVMLNKMPFEKTRDVFEIVPPVELAVEELSNIQKAENDRRMLEEDSVRNAYRATFMTEETAKQMAKTLQLDVDRVANFIKKSEGNWENISNYIRKNAKDERVLDLLDVVSEKDLRDVPEATLTTQLLATKPNTDFPAEIYKEGILKPRLQNEFLRAWKPFFQSKFSAEFAENARKDVAFITTWINQNIEISADGNYARCPVSPQGACELQTTDKQGRNLLFVAICRSLHIPARINTATYQPQYYKNGKWLNISFEPTAEVANATAKLTLLNDRKNPITPEYYIHFTIQHFKNGKFQTLDYEYSNAFKKYPTTLQLEPGYYCLMTGHRDNAGTVQVLRQFFSVEEGKTLKQTITLLPLNQEKKVLAKLDSKTTFADTDNKKHNFANLLKENGAVFAILDPSKEPTRHIMVDIPLLKKDFDKEGVPFVFIVPQDKLTESFSPAVYKDLPKNSLFIIDVDNLLTNSLLQSLKLQKESFYPIVFFANDKAEVTYLSTGYKIGIGENLLREMR